MNLQRREEISVLLAEPVTGEAGQALEYRDALMECRTHIDTLEQSAAERVIARGAVVKPHTFGEVVNQVRDIASQYAGTEQLRERIAYALAPHFERDAGPTPDYTGEGSAWVPPVEERGVVVPELTDEQLRAMLANAAHRCGFVDYEPEDASVGDLEILREVRDDIASLFRASPADRVPGEGMVAVGREKWEAVQVVRRRLLAVSPVHNENQDGCSGPYWECPICGEHTPGEYESKPSAILLRHSAQCAIGALRANQGGTNE